MLSDSDLRELVQFSAQSPVLSLYLNTDPSQGSSEAGKLRARSMIKEIPLPQDIEAIQRYLDHEFDWSGRGVAIFTCAAAGFFRAFPLAVPVRNLVHVGDRPSVKVLADLLDNYGGYGVALIDKQGARLFHFHLGTLVEQEGVLGEEVKHVKRGGSSSIVGQRGGAAGQTRAMEEQVERNMKDAAAFTAHFFEAHHVRRVLIGGTDDNTKLFRSHLPKSWQSLVVGAFPMAMTASHAEVLSRALQVGQEAEAQRESTVIDKVITGAGSGSAVVGLAATLDAVNAGRVQTIVFAEGLRKVGYRAKDSGDLSLTSTDGMEKVFDVLDLAVSSVLRHGGDVEVVRPNEALEKAGSVGAILRY
jgi:peptide chain release factor subunit 1